jgi:tripartite-type tricarboxylate transporter receptor subunit TctC
VPYHGDGPALTDLLSGQVQVMFGTVTSSITQVRAGRLRALAMTSKMRSDALPDVPSVSDFVPDYEAIGFNGIGVPKDTPAAIIDMLNREINAALADDTMKARLADLGLSVLGGSPADFSQLIAEDTKKWAKVIKFAGIKAE